ncbi:MAG: type II secretion system major pseudopilin GspG [Deltaproteobacteria bacterium]|nr:type II secretion system major pseudopilin GspG [Deltaproteobacteria bacterium]
MRKKMKSWKLFSRVNKAAVSRKKRRHAGVTFLEVLVVLIILALIAGIVGTQLMGEAEKAKAEATRIQIKSLESSLNLYRLHNSGYPTTEQSLQALLTRPELGVIPQNWQGPYLNSNSLPKDGWKNEFVYISDGRDYTVISLGADGQEGGSDLAADISSKDL